MDWADLVQVSVLLVTLALYLAIQIVQPPELAGGIPGRKVNSVAIIAVFAGWYDLCDPFVVLLRNEQLGRLSVAADWMERVARFAVLLFGLKSLQNVWQVDFSGALTGAGLAIVS